MVSPITTRYSRPRLAAALAVLAAVLPATTARAQTPLFQTGFEAAQGFSATVATPLTVYAADGTPGTFTPTPGTLYDQAAPNNNYGFLSPETSVAAVQSAVNGVRVVNNSAASGAQSVLFDGAVLGAQDVRYFEPDAYNIAVNGTLNVGIDMRVLNPSANFGQWGINLVSQTASVAAFGFVGGNVLASPDSGTTLYAALNPTTGTPITASYGAYNNYAIQMNYAARTFGATFNGVSVGFVPVDASGSPTGNPVAAIPFRPGTPNHVEYVAFGQAIQRGASESANFDNLRVSGTGVTVAPEAGTLALFLPTLGIAGALVARRVRRRK